MIGIIYETVILLILMKLFEKDNRSSELMYVAGVAIIHALVAFLLSFALGAFEAPQLALFPTGIFLILLLWFLIWNRLQVKPLKAAVFTLVTYIPNFVLGYLVASQA